MDFSALIDALNSTAGQVVIGITMLAAAYFSGSVAMWAYYYVMDMLDDRAARRAGFTRYEFGDGSYEYLSAQEIEDYEYGRDRDESRWS